MKKDAAVWDYSFLTAIARRWGLAIRCSACQVERRWTDCELAERFKTHLDRKIADLRRVLVCSCGSRVVTLYFYMSGCLITGAGFVADIEMKEAELLRRVEILTT